MSQIEQPFDFTVQQFIFYFGALCARHVCTFIFHLSMLALSLSLVLLGFLSRSSTLCDAFVVFHRPAFGSFKPRVFPLYGLIHESIHKQKTWPFTYLRLVT